MHGMMNLHIACSIRSARHELVDERNQARRPQAPGPSQVLLMRRLTVVTCGAQRFCCSQSAGVEQQMCSICHGGLVLVVLSGSDLVPGNTCTFGEVGILRSRPVHQTLVYKLKSHSLHYKVLWKQDCLGYPLMRQLICVNARYIAEKHGGQISSFHSPYPVGYLQQRLLLVPTSGYE